MYKALLHLPRRGRKGVVKSQLKSPEESEGRSHAHQQRRPGLTQTRVSLPQHQRQARRRATPAPVCPWFLLCVRVRCLCFALHGAWCSV